MEICKDCGSVRSRFLVFSREPCYHKHIFLFIFFSIKEARTYYGWFALGVSEKGKVRHVVGTNLKQGDGNLERFKYEIAKNTTGEISFIDIIEIAPIVDGKTYRVLMFQIPAAVTGIPTGWKGNYYARAGESLIPLPQFKIDMIRSQHRLDWSRQLPCFFWEILILIIILQVRHP